MNNLRNDFLSDLKKLYSRRGADWREVNIFGIRHEENQALDSFNDFIGIATDNECHLFPGTTDPGIQITQNKEGGAAHLCLGWHPDIWVIDIHAPAVPEFKHLAFCSRKEYGCKPTRIYRDVNRDGKFTQGIDVVQNGFFSINCHRASVVRHENKIGLYSAGCQVLQNAADLEFMLKITQLSNMYEADHLCKLSYMLFDKSEISL